MNDAPAYVRLHATGLTGVQGTRYICYGESPQLGNVSIPRRMSAYPSPAEKVRKIDLLRTFPVVLGNADIRRGVSAFPTGNDSILHFSLEEGNCLKTKATIESMVKF